MIQTLAIPAVTALLLLPVTLLVARYQGWPHLSEGRSIFSVLLIAALTLRALVWTAFSWVFPDRFAGDLIIFARAMPTSIYEIAAFVVLAILAVIWNARISWNKSRAEQTKIAVRPVMERQE